MHLDQVVTQGDTQLMEEWNAGQASFHRQRKMVRYCLMREDFHLVSRDGMEMAEGERSQESGEMFENGAGGSRMNKHKTRILISVTSKVINRIIRVGNDSKLNST